MLSQPRMLQHRKGGSCEWLSGKEAVVAYLKECLLSQNLLGGIEENHEELVSG
jgi:hypothetical protein